MRLSDLKMVLRQVGVEIDEPNAAGWSHAACPFAPWKNRSGHDTSKGCAFKAEDHGISAYSCPACKSHGRIDALLHELGYLRQVDYSALVEQVRAVETVGAMFVPPWDQRAVATVDVLPPPLDPVFYDPLLIFEDVQQHPEAYAYLRARWVSDDAIAKATIRFDPEKRRLVFPVYDDKGALYGFTGRTILPDHHPKVLDYANLPKRMLLLGEHRWQPGRPVVVVEGLFAYARFLTEGVDTFANVCALLGSEVTPAKAARLRVWGCPVYMFTDPDQAGRDAIYGTAKNPEKGAIAMLAEHVRVYVPEYPETIHDPDWLSRDGVWNMMANATLCFPRHRRRDRS